MPVLPRSGPEFLFGKWTQGRACLRATPGGAAGRGAKRHKTVTGRRYVILAASSLPLLSGHGSRGCTLLGDMSDSCSSRAAVGGGCCGVSDSRKASCAGRRLSFSGRPETRRVRADRRESLACPVDFPPGSFPVRGVAPVVCGLRRRDARQPPANCGQKSGIFGDLLPVVRLLYGEESGARAAFRGFGRFLAESVF